MSGWSGCGGTIDLLGNGTCRRPVRFASPDDQVVADASKAIRPIMRPRLTIDTHEGVPWAVAAIMQPPPAPIITGQQPYALAQRSGQMRNRRINRDDQVQIGDQRRCI